MHAHLLSHPWDSDGHLIPRWDRGSTLHLSRKEIVERLRYLKPNEQLRAKWQYNNLMFLTAGYLIDPARTSTSRKACFS